jgi:hypothetical protein
MWPVNLSSGLLLFLLGYLIRVYRLSFLVAGYNTASKKEREKYDVEKMTRGVGNMLMISSSFLIFGGIIAILLDTHAMMIMHASWIMFTLFMLGAVVYVNFTGCLKKKEVLDGS